MPTRLEWSPHAKSQTIHHIISPLSPLSSPGDLENLKQTSHRSINILNNIWHLTIRTLLHDRHERKILINLPQQNRSPTIREHNAALRILARNLMLKLLIPRRAFKTLDILIRAIPAIYLRDVDNDVDVIAADLVGRHIDGGGIGGNVDLGEDIEEIRFLEAGFLAAVIEQGFQVRQVRDEFLDDFGEGFEDGMVVYGGEVEVDGGVLDAMVRELVLDALGDVALDVELVVVRQAVDFVDEDFDVDVWVGGLQVQDGAVEAVDGFEVLVLGVDDPDQGSDFAEDGVEVEGWVCPVNLAGEVPDLEVHERAGVVSIGLTKRGRETHCIESFWIRAVDSRNSVSFGGILWNTTLEMDDFPLLLLVSDAIISGVAKLTFADPSTAISACLSRRHLEQAQEPSQGQSFGHLLGSVREYVQE